MRLKTIAAAIALALPAFAFAQAATAWKEDFCDMWSGGDGGCSKTVSNVTVQINVSPSDAGKPGAFFIGARATSGTPGSTANINYDTIALWLYTPTGWKQFNGGTYEPIEFFTTGMPAGRNYLVADHQDLCALVTDKNMELWAGYGVLQPDKAAAVDTYLTLKTRNIPPDHLRAVYVYNDMKEAKKYWNVLNMSACYGPSDSGGGGS